MKLIVGLGNIGEKYKNNRHNMGFKAIDFLSEELGITLNKTKFSGEFYKGDDYIIAKPHTFMNLSGDFVFDICQFYKIDKEDILVIYDDADLEVGDIRFREKGSSGGQNGIKDIMLKMKTDEIKRIKIGVGRQENFLSNYVLSDFSKEQWKTIESKKTEIVKSIIDFIEK